MPASPLQENTKTYKYNDTHVIYRINKTVYWVWVYQFLQLKQIKKDFINWQETKTWSILQDISPSQSFPGWLCKGPSSCLPCPHIAAAPNGVSSPGVSWSHVGSMLQEVNVLSYIQYICYLLLRVMMEIIQMTSRVNTQSAKIKLDLQYSKYSILCDLGGR